jgi:hypothetical protein
MMKRPRTLNEVSRRVLSGDDEFSPALREFLDTFYLSEDQMRSIGLRERPLLIDPVSDAYLSATAEHLALQYGLEVPPWTETQGHALKRPQFFGGSLKAILIVESPLAFRRRLLFVSANALDRASMHSSNAVPNSRFL